jgi:hypothetical protein
LDIYLSPEPTEKSIINHAVFPNLSGAVRLGV